MKKIEKKKRKLGKMYEIELKFGKIENYTKLENMDKKEPN